MLFDELTAQLRDIQPDIDAIKAYWDNARLEAKFMTLHGQIQAEDFWRMDDHIAISKSYQQVKTLREEYQKLLKYHDENKELISLFGENEEELKKIKGEVAHLCSRIKAFKIQLLLSSETDQRNCFLSINAGAGGTESQDWTSMLLRMYLRFCEREGLKVDILDRQDGEEAGIKSATLFVRGTNAYGLLKSENGIHRLVRISPFDSSKRRHTSFAAVALVPEVEDKKVEIKDDDLRIDTYRASGSGGQHVNTTDSAVRITHLPTGIVVQCQNERSQLQNKQTAMKMLMAKLVEKKENDARAKAASVEKKKIEWGSQIRSYVLHPYKMVKDHRTNFESPQPELVLDGDLMAFIESYLITTDR